MSEQARTRMAEAMNQNGDQDQEPVDLSSVPTRALLDELAARIPEPET